MIGNEILLSVTYLDKNEGHGNARRLSIKKCRNEYIAIMDSDDLSLPRRFENQMNCFASNPEVSVVGGQIIEFIGTPDNLTGMRTVPCIDSEIKDFMRKRCPMNQVSVMLKKQDYDSVGGYIDWYCEEDYFLWLRMAEAGLTFANCPNPLVLVRIGDQMSARRGGWKYFHSEERLQRLMLKKGVISIPRYLINTVMRLFGEVLIPTKVRTELFKKLRDKPDASTLLSGDKITDMSGKCIHAFPPFSVAMCVYGGDNALWFDEAINSVVNQSVPPDEIVIVVDGPIPSDIQTVIDKWSEILTRGGGYNS